MPSCVPVALLQCGASHDAQTKNMHPPPAHPDYSVHNSQLNLRVAHRRAAAPASLALQSLHSLANASPGT